MKQFHLLYIYYINIVDYLLNIFYVVINYEYVMLDYTLVLIVHTHMCFLYESEPSYTHTLNVMHYEKQFIENVINIMFGEGDTISMQKYIKDMNIQCELWPIPKKKEGEFHLLVASYVLDLKERKTFMQIIKGLKTLT